jgi:hypothetical protein
LIENDKTYFSDRIVNLFKNKKFQNYVGAAAYAIYYLASQAAPTRAIKPELGGDIANLAAAQSEVSLHIVVGDIPGTLDINSKIQAAGAINNNISKLPDNGPILNKVGQYAIANCDKFEAPPQASNNSPVVITGPPTTPFWKSLNSAAVGTGIVALCLNCA